MADSNTDVNIDTTSDGVVDLASVVANDIKKPTDPALQYDSEEDPEINSEATFTEGIKSPFRTALNEESLRENFNCQKSLLDYIQSLGFDMSKFDMYTYISKYVPANNNWYHRTENVEDQLNKLLVSSKFKQMKSILGSVVQNGPQSSILAVNQSSIPDVPEEIDTSDMSETAKMMVDNYEDSADAAVSVEESVNEKYKGLYYTARGILTGRSLRHFAFLAGSGGIGKSFSVKLAIQDSWESSVLKARGWRVVMKSGDIGSSISPVVAFFYTHRDNEVIVLDDCDGFILNKQQSVQNFLKAILDQDVKAVSISPTIRNKVNDYINGKNRQAECKISIDQNKLQENILAVSVNGKLACEEKISEADAKDFGKYPSSGLSSLTERMNAVMHRNHFLEADEEESEEETDEELGFSSQSDTPDDESEEVPEEFVFKSRMIMISNLFLRDVNQAVRSRCDCTEITLSPDEFCCRLKQIIGTLKMSDDSEYPGWMQEYAKNEVFGDLSAVLEIQKKGLSLFGNTITVADGVLQFRIIPELAGRWCSRCDIYCDDTGGNETEDTLPDIAAAIRKNFIKYDLLKVLHGDTRDNK